MNFRSLTPHEIKHLEQNGCRAQSWDDITVSNEFDPTRVKNVEFTGKVSISRLKKEVKVYENLLRPAGLYNSHIQDCTIHEDVYLSDVKFIANYEIKANTIINNVAVLAVTGESRFGNGVEIDIFN